MGSRRQGGQVRRYKDTLKTSLKQLKTKQVAREDLASNRPAWRRTVKTEAAIYETNRTTATKTKRAARKSPVPRPNTVNAQALPTYPRCQSTFQTTSHYSSPVYSTTTTSDVDSLLNCPHCGRTFTSRIGLVGRLRIHRTEAAEKVPGAPTFSRHARLHCLPCSHTFAHRMGLLGHMHFHDNLRTHNPWDPSKVWSYAEGQLRPRQLHAPSRISGLLDSVVAPLSGGEEERVR
ncbi:unnamed protein product [Schistocephalus solidus]|uniref:C2H2-type domain-containing protein n=1 Tax=Schistocephalus solidus TaxID=70667 RepID=A0A183S9X6_SCHSO|nr:unnamed protein product [Schistocephalus solidus]